MDVNDKWRKSSSNGHPMDTFFLFIKSVKTIVRSDSKTDVNLVDVRNLNNLIKDEKSYKTR